MFRKLMENRRGGRVTADGWDFLTVIGYKLVALTCILQVAVCGSGAVMDSNPSLADFYLTAAKPFEASPDASEACKRDTEIFHKGLADLEMWAVKMYDSTAKPPSGIIRGNVNQFGDYDECVEALQPATNQGESDAIAGQYCLTTLFVELAPREGSSTKAERLTDILDNVHSHSGMKSAFQDTPTFFPSFSPMSWGVCVPSSCSMSDVLSSLTHRLSSINASTAAGDLIFRIKIEKGNCEVKQEFNIRPGTVYALILLATMVSLSIVGTIYDIKTADKAVARSIGGRVLLAYSIRRNLRQLFRTTPRPGTETTPGDDIGCIHGIRAIFSISIYTIHRVVFGLFIPFTNRTYIAELLEGDWTMIFRAFWNNVDTFVILSGLLTSFFAIKKLQDGKGMNIPRMYLQRYFKFTPIFLMIVLAVGQFAGKAGPQDLRVVNHFVKNCQEPWVIAKTLLYANNFNGMENMCYPPSHQLVTDMQMYLTAPFFILLLWKWPKRGPIILLSIIAALASYKYAVIFTSKLNSVIFHGVSQSEMVLAARLVYLNPVHRLTPYLFGVGLGYLLRRTGGKSSLGRGQLFIGWCMSLYAMYYSFFGAKGAARRDYVPDIGAASLFGAFQPILWSCSLGWIIYACHVGKAGALNRFLSWKGFEVFSRLSYAVYMVQIVIIFLNIGNVKSPEHFGFHKLIDLNEIAVILFLAVALTLLFLMPYIELWKIMNGLEMRVERPTREEPKRKQRQDEEAEHIIRSQDTSTIPKEPQKTPYDFSAKNEDCYSRNT